MATRGLPFYWRCICVYLLKRKTSTLPFQQNVLFSNLGARTAARALQIYDLLKRKSFFDIYMKQTFYLKQTLLKQKWSEISHRIWKVLSFFVRVFIYLLILYQAVSRIFFNWFVYFWGGPLWNFALPGHSTFRHQISKWAKISVYVFVAPSAQCRADRSRNLSALKFKICPKSWVIWRQRYLANGWRYRAEILHVKTWGQNMASNKFSALYLEPFRKYRRS